MPEPMRRPQDRMPLSQRAGLVAKGFRSMLARYPKDLAKAVRGKGMPGHGAEPGLVLAPDLREKWAALPTGPGVTGVLWLGHCTVLLKIGGLTVLTDPVLSPVIGPRVGLGRWVRTLGPSRLTPPGAFAHELPRPDLILLSHAHYDHLDRPTLRALVDRRTTVVTAARTRGLVPRGFGHVLEVPWGTGREVEGLVVEGLRPKHWGARNAWDRHRGYNSYLLRSGPGPVRLLFAGDTAYTDAYRGVGPVDLAVFGVGAYDPWHHAHATPEEAWAMAREAGAGLMLPVHYGTFKLSNEPAEEPIARLLAAAGGAGAGAGGGSGVLVLGPGELRSFAGGGLHRGEGLG